ncbi:MAG: cytochrome c3 family protein [Acidobacteriota bacterium]
MTPPRIVWSIATAALLIHAVPWGTSQRLSAQSPSAMATEAFKEDVHASAGLSCAACHASAADPLASYAPIDRTRIAPMCARCHSDAAYMRDFDPQARVDQHAQYQTSTHGRSMARGERRVATCSDCHRAHGVLRASDVRSPVAPKNISETCGRCHADAALMVAFGHTSTPVADWSTSVHATALVRRGDTSAPTCNTCHGSHGATPPGVAHVAVVCAQCHVREASLFRASPKQAIFEAIGQAECMSCHGNHAIPQPDDTLVGLSAPAVCADCHDSSSNGASTITRVRSGLDTLAATMAVAGDVLRRAEQAGMLVDEGRVALHQAREQQIQSRVLVHAFADVPFAETADKGIEAARRAESAALAALAELQVRRRGLAVATVFILGFLITLGIKIRRLPVPRA